MKALDSALAMPGRVETPTVSTTTRRYVQSCRSRQMAKMGVARHDSAS